MKKSASPSNPGIIRQYYLLAKPGIVYGNALAAIAGFLFAAGRQLDLLLFAATIAGTCLIIASACVFNNYLDQNIDRQMHRTRGRALVTRQISARRALWYGAILGLLGFGLLVSLVNLLTAWIGLVGFVSYVVVYGYAKRRTHWGTLVGTIPGATPPVAGYAAVGGQLDLTALILFLILVTWQMPHFYAIALFRLKDYKAANIPVLPAVRRLKRTKYEIIGYVIAFAIATLSLPFFDRTGYAYVFILLVTSIWWFRLALEGFSASDDTLWARRVFGRSLYVLLIFCAALALSPWLP